MLLYLYHNSDQRRMSQHLPGPGRGAAMRPSHPVRMTYCTYLKVSRRGAAEKKLPCCTEGGPCSAGPWPGEEPRPSPHTGAQEIQAQSGHILTFIHTWPKGNGQTGRSPPGAVHGLTNQNEDTLECRASLGLRRVKRKHKTG